MATVTGFQFGIGDGVTTAFNIMDPSGSVAVNPVVSSLYRTDWQGKQLLYTTSRTNLVPRSEEFNDAGWAKTRSLVVADQIAAPSGAVTADKLTGNNLAFPNVNRSIAVLASNSYTLTAFVKAGTHTTALLQFFSAAGGARETDFNLATGTITSGAAGASITALVDIFGIPTGWYALKKTISTVVGEVSVLITIGIGVGGAVLQTTDYVYIWGADLKNSATPSGYIPTAAAAASVTDYSVAASVATLSPAPVSNALLEWTGTDDNAAFNPSYGSASMVSGFGKMGGR